MKKKIILTFLVTILFVTGFGCKGLSAEEKASIKAVRLNYWTVYDDVEQLKKFADEYHARHSYVTINIKKIRYEEFEKLFVNALADDVAPDIISVHNRWLNGYKGRLAKMPPSAKVSRIQVQGKYFKETVILQDTSALPTVNFVKSSYINAVHDDVVSGGKDIYGLPLSMDTLAIYYNKDLLDKANIPEPPQTWGEFMEMMKKLTRVDEDGKIIQSGVALGTGNNIDNAFDILSLFMMQSGIKMSVGNYITFAGGLDKNASGHPVFRALDFYTDFAKDNKVVYSWNEEMGNALTEFTRGKSAFYFGFAYDYPTIKSRAPQMKLEIIPVPQLNESSPQNVANYWVQSVVAKSKHKDEAWDFIRYISSPENVKKYTDATKRPSPFRAHISQQKEDLVLAPFVANILTATNWYRGRNYETAKKAFMDMIHKYLQPYTGEDKLKNDANNVIYTQRVIQQTM